MKNRFIEKPLRGLINRRKLQLSNRRIYPAIDITSSGTRREDLLISKEQLQRIWLIPKFIADMNPVEAMEFMKDRISNTKSNEEFLATMNS